MTREEKIDFANGIASDLEDEGYKYNPDDNGDSPEDLSDAELETLMNQLLTKAKRPRRTIGTI